MLVCMGICLSFGWEHFFESSVETWSHVSLSPHSVHTAQKWVSRTMSWLQQNCHPIILSINIQSLIFLKWGMCVCVCTRHAVISQSLAQWQRHSFLCISFQFNRADSRVNRLSAHSVREPGWEKCRVLKQHTGHINPEKWLLSFKKTPRSHTTYASDVWAEREERVLPALWGPAWESREWRDLPVQGTTGGHAACARATDPSLLEVWNAEDVGSNGGTKSEGFTKEPVLAQNHVQILWEKGNSKGRSFNQSAQKKPNDHGGFVKFKADTFIHTGFYTLDFIPNWSVQHH